jgi:PTH1 family peptidyl-tRNA hydrolase
MEHVKLFLGLGNPGMEYERTFHNAGVLALHALADAMPAPTGIAWQNHKKIFRYATCDGMIFVEPLTFMNESGRAAREAMKKFDLAPQDIVVLHDDSDLPLGTWKVSRGHGAGGHHGIESIINTLGTNDFTRVRIGIRPATERERQKAGEFVLKKMTKKDRAVLDAIFLKIRDHFFNENVIENV